MFGLKIVKETHYIDLLLSIEAKDALIKSKDDQIARLEKEVETLEGRLNTVSYELDMLRQPSVEHEVVLLEDTPAMPASVNDEPRKKSRKKSGSSTPRRKVVKKSE